MSARVGSLVKSAGQPDAGNPHVRLEEGAPVAAATAGYSGTAYRKGQLQLWPVLQPNPTGPYSTIPDRHPATPAARRTIHVRGLMRAFRCSGSRGG